jgi:hypothetical protein
MRRDREDRAQGAEEIGLEHEVHLTGPGVDVDVVPSASRAGAEGCRGARPDRERPAEHEPKAIHGGAGSESAVARDEQLGGQAALGGGTGGHYHESDAGPD